MFSNRISEINLLRASGLIDPEMLSLAMGRDGIDSGVPVEFIYLENQKYWGAATSPLFDGKHYLDTYPDVQASLVNPLLHYVSHGYREGRVPSMLVEIDYIVEQLATPNVLEDERLFGEFARETLQRYSGIHELLSKAGCNPSRFFDNEFYRKVNAADADEIGSIPLEHYLRSKGRSKRGGYLECTPLASMSFYMESNPDLRTAKVTPLSHLIQYGMSEGRRFSKEERVSSDFLRNSAQLFRKPSMSSLSGFLVETSGSGQLAGPYWPTRYAKRSIPSLAHTASGDRSAFVGIVLYENSDEEIRRLEQSIRKEIAETKGYRIDYAYLANDAHNEERYRRLLGSRVRVAPDGRNLGFGVGHNLLMKEAFERSGLYIGANPDGHFTPGSIKALIDFSDFHAGHALIEAPAFPVDHPKWHDPVTLDTCWVSGACFALPKALWQEVQGFDDAIHMYCEDVDLSWRVRLIGGSLKVCPTAKFVHDVTPRFVKKDREVNRAESGRRKAMLTGAYYLARKWGGPDQVARARSELLSELSMEEIASLPKPAVIIDAEISTKVADFSFERFAPSRFW